MPQSSRPLDVHVLIDLEWQATSGGQVTCWQRLAEAARDVPELRLTLHAQGEKEERRELHEKARLMLHRPVFSTKRIPFLHTPAHTDLAGFHPDLAAAMDGAEVIHTTDGFFAYAKTAEKISKWKKIPLTHSVHTDMVSYARLFAREFLSQLLGGLGRWIDTFFCISRGVEKNMARKLKKHEAACRFVLAAREEDKKAAQAVLGAERVKTYRLGLDADLFHPDKRDKAAFCARHGLPPNAVLVLFVGRLDAGKNIYRLITLSSTLGS